MWDVTSGMWVQCHLVEYINISGKSALPIFKAIFPKLKTDPVYFANVTNFYKSTRCNIPKESVLHSHSSHHSDY
jgi:hypothetical protein